MPQLPSGRQIALSPKPLDELFRESRRPDNVHKLLGIRTERDLWRFVDILRLVPDSGGVPMEITLRGDSNPIPQGRELEPAGYRLSEWEAEASGWTEEDRGAFREWLAGQAAPAFAEWLEAVRDEQTRLRGTGDFLTRVLAGWWDAGCHPAQEEGWDESDVGSPDWDDYDLLAAIGQLRSDLVAGGSDGEFADALARLDAFWGICVREMPDIRGIDLNPRPVRDCAGEMRDAGLLEAVAADSRKWLHDQAVTECVLAWSSLGEGLRARAPQAYGILELVVVSGEAERHFGRG